MLVEFSIPVYNEAKILKKNVLTLFDYLDKKNLPYAWQIMIVANGTTDDSIFYCTELAQQFLGKINFVDIKKAGKGQALKQSWMASAADIILFMDIDLAVSLADIEKLVSPLIAGQADLAIGSRLMSESKIERSFIRELSSQTYNFLSRIILRHNFSDMQCGFKAIKIEAFKKVAPFLQDPKWFFDTELIIFTNALGYRVKEIPVDWSENRYDERKSKVHFLRDGLKFSWNLIKLKNKILKLKKIEN
ncbi:MAG: glycosyltransferase [Candidatus Falkowbacteria bacterium]|nr:glycosyltransferase [Candidatus Falkowbacteria bacterium]